MDDDAGLVERLRAGDEFAFVEMVRRYQSRLPRLAEATVGSHAVAEEACQETWLAVVRGLERFEGRSSFRTWLYRILLNRARSTAGREQRAGRPDDEVVELGRSAFAPSAGRSCPYRPPVLPADACAGVVGSESTRARRRSTGLVPGAVLRR